MTTFSDDFNRADSTDLGPNWVEVSGDWSIVTGLLSPGSAGGTIILRAAASMSSNDNYAQAKIAATSAVSQGVWCRGNSNISSGYLWRNNGTSWDLFSVVGGSFTVIGTYTAAAAVGDVAKVQAVGTTIKGYVNDVELVSVINSAVATGTSVGIRCESSSSLRWDNFSAGDIGGTSFTAGIASEIETANTPTASKSTSSVTASEIETSRVVSMGKALSVGSAFETESALTVLSGKSSSLLPAQEIENSLPYAGIKSVVVGVAASTETALSPIGSKRFVVTPAVELNTALQITTTSGGEVPPVAQSILTSVKKILGIAESDTSFDLDIIIHINSVFSTLDQLGIGPAGGFMIEDSGATWDSFTTDKRMNSVKTYVYLRVRLLFDPPSTSFVIESMNKQISELEWRLNVVREGDSWVDPDPQPVVTSDTWW